MGVTSTLVTACCVMILTLHLCDAFGAMYPGSYYRMLLRMNRPLRKNARTAPAPSRLWGLVDPSKAGREHFYNRSRVSFKNQRQDWRKNVHKPLKLRYNSKKDNNYLNKKVTSNYVNVAAPPNHVPAASHGSNLLQKHTQQILQNIDFTSLNQGLTTDSAALNIKVTPNNASGTFLSKDLSVNKQVEKVTVDSQSDQRAPLYAEKQNTAGNKVGNTTGNKVGTSLPQHQGRGVPRTVANDAGQQMGGEGLGDKEGNIGGAEGHGTVEGHEGGEVGRSPLRESSKKQVRRTDGEQHLQREGGGAMGDTDCGDTWTFDLNPHVPIHDQRQRAFHKLIKTPGYNTGHLYSEGLTCTWTLHIGPSCQYGMVSYTLRPSHIRRSHACLADHLDILYNGKRTSRYCGPLSRKQKLSGAQIWSDTEPKNLTIKFESGRALKFMEKAGHWGIDLELAAYCWGYSKSFKEQLEDFRKTGIIQDRSSIHVSPTVMQDTTVTSVQTFSSPDNQKYQSIATASSEIHNITTFEVTMPTSAITTSTSEMPNITTSEVIMPTSVITTLTSEMSNITTSEVTMPTSVITTSITESTEQSSQDANLTVHLSNPMASSTNTSVDFTNLTSSDNKAVMAESSELSISNNTNSVAQSNQTMDEISPKVSFDTITGADPQMKYSSDAASHVTDNTNEEQLNETQNYSEEISYASTKTNEISTSGFDSQTVTSPLYSSTEITRIENETPFVYYNPYDTYTSEDAKLDATTTSDISIIRVSVTPPVDTYTIRSEELPEFTVEIEESTVHPADEREANDSNSTTESEVITLPDTTHEDAVSTSRTPGTTPASSTSTTTNQEHIDQSSPENSSHVDSNENSTVNVGTVTDQFFTSTTSQISTTVGSTKFRTMNLPLAYARRASQDNSSVRENKDKGKTLTRKNLNAKYIRLPSNHPGFPSHRLVTT